MLLDPSSLAVVALPVASGLYPHHLSVSPNKTRVLISAPSTDLSLGHSGNAHGGGHGSAGRTTIYQLDLLSGSLSPAFEVSATVHNASFSNDGNVIYVGMMEHGMIAGHDARTYGEIFNVGGFEMPLEVTPTPQGLLLVAESAAARVASVNIASRSVVARLDVGAVPVAAWASGANFFVSVEESKIVRHLSEESSLALDAHSIDPGGIPGQAVVAPNGELWVAVEDRGVVAIFSSRTHDKLAEVSCGNSPHGIAFSSDGTRAFVTDQEGGAIYAVDVASRTIASIVPTGGKPNGIMWIER